MKNPAFHFHRTADGSPTLSQEENGEWMHHRQGAFSETQFVYGEAVSRVLPISPAPAFVSVGLGLGYVEFLLAARAVQANARESFAIRSFESQVVLRENFTEWLKGKTEGEFGNAYDSIAQLYAQHFDVPPQKLKDCLREWLEAGRWKLEASLDTAVLWARRYDAILYDAYSSETAPELWNEELLGGVLSNAAGPRCTFATYASTGSLKRILEKHRFRLEARPGFSGKRECTLAVRP
jgi:hypothetical protein